MASEDAKELLMALESLKPDEVRGSLSAVVNHASGSSKGALASGPDCLLQVGTSSFEVEIVVVSQDVKRRKLRAN